MEIVETITLIEPVTVELKDGDGNIREEKITALEFRKPKVKHLRATDRADGDVAKAAELVAVLTGQPVRVIDELGAEDFAKCADLVERFFPKRSRRTGRKS